jgi:hypothetical protein
MEAENEQLQLEGARGMWELSINKPHHAEMQACHLRLLVKHLQSANIEVRRRIHCAAAQVQAASSKHPAAQQQQQQNAASCSCSS